MSIERVYYHTQESRYKQLSAPVKCVRNDAWLGHGFYFWYDEYDAIKWGETSKKRTNAFEIYKANIDCENILDTVFNEDHYLFWLKQIEKASKYIQDNTDKIPTIGELNRYFVDKKIWSEVTGIQFQDTPSNQTLLLVKPIQYGTKQVPFVYRKRIQLVVYDTNIISNFTLYKKQYLHY